MERKRKEVIETIKGMQPLLADHSEQGQKVVDILLEKCLTDYAIEYHQANLSKTSARLLQKVNQLRARLKKKPLNLRDL